MTDQPNPSSGNWVDAVVGGIGTNPPLSAEMQRKNQGAQSAEKFAQDAAALVKNADHDPDYVTFREPFLTMRHQAILDGVQSMTPGVMQSLAENWKKLADSAMFNVMGLNGKVHQTLASGGLVGHTADAFQAATERFVSELTDMHNVTQSVTSRIESAATTAEVVRAAVRPVPAADHDIVLPGAPNPAAVMGNVAKASEAEQQAQRAMNAYYTPVYPVVGQQVPMYTPPNGPAGGGAAPGTAAPGAGAAGGQGPGGNAAAQPNSGQHGTAPGDKPGAPGDQPGSGGNPDQQGQHPGGPGSGAADGTTPAAAGTGTGGLPGAGSTPGADAVTPAGWSPGSGGSGGAGFGGSDGGFGGGGSGGLPGSGDAKGGPGRSLPGPGRAGAGTSGTGGVRPAAAAAGASGFPGMGMGMPGAKGKEKDKEHKGKPELLVNERNARDLIGDPVKAAPPVFGKNPEADTQSPESEQERRRR